MNFSRTFSKWMTRGLRLAGRLPLIGNAIVKASFDAVRQTWGERSLMFQSLQDAWLEIDRLTRYELQRVHGGLVENSCIVQKIRCLFIQFSVGAGGLKCTPNASSMDSVPGADTAAEKTAVENWNTARGENWERWFRSPELNSTISGAQSTRVWSGLLFDTGEIFLNLTFEDQKVPRGVVASRTPKFQTIDSHRCETPADRKEYNGNPIIDGVEMTPAGRPVAYWFKKTNFEALLTNGVAGEQLFDRIPAYDCRNWKAGGVIHTFKHRRPGQVRGIPEGFSVYNLVRDNMDLHKLEMQAAKLASDIANVETNPTGELDTTTNRSARTNILSQTASGAYATKNIGVDYKVSIGSKNIALREGSSLQQFMINRPTVATQDYWDLHYTMICTGYNVPKMLVMPYSLQGTVTRADLDICGYGFGQENFELIAELLTTVYEWQSQWAHDYDLTMDGAWPEDYCAVFIRPPRKPNVDIGYTAKAVETEVLLGIRTIPDIYAEKQQDWRVKTIEICEYLKFVQDHASQFGVAAGKVTQLLQEDGTQNPDAIGEETEGKESTEETADKNKSESLLKEFNSYGIAVRAGAITPTPEDEIYFRSKAGLPSITAEARQSWAKENNTRRPITLSTTDVKPDTQTESEDPNPETELEKQVVHE